MLTLNILGAAYYIARLKIKLKYFIQNTHNILLQHYDGGEINSSNVIRGDGIPNLESC